VTALFGQIVSGQKPDCTAGCVEPTKKGSGLIQVVVRFLFLIKNTLSAGKREGDSGRDLIITTFDA